MPTISVKNNPPPKSFKASILEKEGTWWVAKVRSRQEKEFAFDLLDSCADYYLPCYLKKTKRSDGAFRKSILVLFPSYVPFISENPHDFLWHKRVEKILPVNRQAKFKEELHYIFLANTSGIPVEPVLETRSFTRGEPVEIIAGPLRGAAGVVVNTQNEKREIILSTDVLGYSKVTVDAEMIRSKKLGASVPSLDTRVPEGSLLVKSTIPRNINKHKILTSRCLSLN